MDHDKITEMIGGAENYGKGIFPNPFSPQQKEWQRRKENMGARAKISAKIDTLFEPRFITPPETSELIEAIITATDSRKILELGTCTGFTTLHMLRALIGKENAKIVSVDCRPAHDREFWSDFSGILTFLEGWTPKVLEALEGEVFDLVFVDSDHAVDHTKAELLALLKITRSGSIFLFHDIPEWQTPSTREPVPVRDFLLGTLVQKAFYGVPLQTCEQLDCLDAYGPGYPIQCNPGLGIFVRR